jgi:hypothetical protein
MNFSPSVLSNNNKPASRLLQHKEMYKSPCRDAQASHDNQNVPAEASPSWRVAYKKRCFDEFKKSRQKLLSKFRNLQVRFQIINSL